LRFPKLRSNIHSKEVISFHTIISRRVAWRLVSRVLQNFVVWRICIEKSEIFTKSRRPKRSGPLDARRIHGSR